MVDTMIRICRKLDIAIEVGVRFSTVLNEIGISWVLINSTSNYVNSTFASLNACNCTHRTYRNRCRRIAIKELY